MSQLSKAGYEALYGTSGSTFADNTTGDIGAGDVRTFGKDTSDSAMFLSDNFIDEDSFATDSATKAPSQQSVKAYIAAQILASAGTSASVLVDTADVLTANSVPYTIIAAQGAATIIQPVAIEVSYDYQTAAFATNTNFVFTINGVEVSGSNSTLLTRTADYVAFVLPIAVENTVATLANQPLKFFVKSGNPTGGGNSAIRVNIIYKVVSTTV